VKMCRVTTRHRHIRQLRPQVGVRFALRFQVGFEGLTKCLRTLEALPPFPTEQEREPEQRNSPNNNKDYPPDVPPHS